MISDVVAYLYPRQHWLMPRQRHWKTW